MKKNSPRSKAVNLVYKKLGETPNEAILRLKKENPELDLLPMTYAGRLDPMAEGLLLILSGEEINAKEKYLDLPKTYEAEILWGFETDTLDILGLSNTSPRVTSDEVFPSEEKLKKYLSKTKGKFEQVYPIYSSRPVQGKPLFQWAREGKANQIEIPKHEVEIYESSFVERKYVSGKELLEEIVKRVALVKGDFRQEEIISKWKEVFKNEKSVEFVADKISLKVSSGFYVRQFIYDLAKNFKSNAVTYSIRRTNIGNYSITDFGV